MNEKPWPPRGGNIMARERHQALIEDYLEIGGSQLSARLAAIRLGVSRRHIFRLRAKLRQGSVPR